MMQCEIETRFRCGCDMGGNRYRLTVMHQLKPRSWDAIGVNWYYCRECIKDVMAEIEREDAR